MIGIRSGPVRVLGSGAEGIQATLDAKANRYGDLDAPFVVAIWIGSRYTSPGALGEALFGFETPSDLGAHATHLPSHVERDGIWTPNRQRRGRISAVLRRLGGRLAQLRLRV